MNVPAHHPVTGHTPRLGTPGNLSHPTRAKSYLLALVSVQLNRIAGVIVGFWLTPFVLGFLDPSEYGLYALAIGVASWLGVCDLGLSAGLQVELSRQWQTRDRFPLVRYASSAFHGQLVLACLIVGLAAGVSGIVPRLLEVPVAHIANAQTLIVVLGASTAVVVASGTFGAVLTAYRRAHVDNIIQFAVAMVRVGLTVSFLVSGYGLLSLAWAHLAGSVVGVLLAFVGSRAGISGFRLSPRHVSWPAVRELSGLGFWFSLGGLGGLFILATDRAFAAKLVSLEAVAVLYLTSRLYNLAETLLGPIVNSARPAMGELLGEGRCDGVARVYGSVERAALVAACAAALAIWAGNEAFVTAWVGAKYYGGWMLDAALAVALVTRAWILPKRALLSAAKVVRPQALSRLSEGGLNLVLSWILGRWLGLLGIVISTSLAAVATSCWYLQRLTREALGSLTETGPSFPFRRACAGGALLLSIACMARWLAGEVGGYLGACLAMTMTSLSVLAAAWPSIDHDRLRTRLGRVVPATVGP